MTYPYQRGYAQRRRDLLQTGESEGGGSGLAAGCFPDLYTQQDFIDWLDGSYIGMSAPRMTLFWSLTLHLHMKSLPLCVTTCRSCTSSFISQQ